jgi:predicted RNA-binding Zn-ribbon protein involved in translation (DUF1610 family)
MTAANEQTKMMRYSGFTCPNCGSHFFGTTTWFAKMNRDLVYSYVNYEPGTQVGFCHAHQHTGNGCRFTWDRSDPVQETQCLYKLSSEEYGTAEIVNTAR